MVIMALSYMASNSYQDSIADALRVAQSTVSRSIAAVTKAIAGKIDEFIRWPTEEEQRREIMEEFYQVAHFSKVIGVVDGTHVWIRSPGQDDQSFRNRKGYTSLNVMVR